jgi:hypothetical protein
MITHHDNNLDSNDRELEDLPTDPTRLPVPVNSEQLELDVDEQNSVTMASFVEKEPVGHIRELSTDIVSPDSQTCEIKHYSPKFSKEQYSIRVARSDGELYIN